ncbi:MAG TPA: hypothetical protein VJG32_11920 [Anaerolineae bacterium]|nr:hypothetical protein [Anaerolineae bacterium]
MTFKFFGSRLQRWLIVLCIPLAVLIALFSGLFASQEARAGQSEASAALTPRSSYLYRFNPVAQTFFTVPLQLGSTPYGVAVTGANPTHVWVAEYGLNRIGHLIYTSTVSSSYISYPVTSTANSGPFRLALHGNFVWFTERGANRIGRLNVTTGQINEFSTGLSPNSGLADIRVAPNGWVWASGQASNRLIRLVVTSTLNYNIREYSHATMAGIFGLSVETSEYIWFASPISGTIGRLDVVNNVVNNLSFFFPAGSSPFEIVNTGSYAWFTDPKRNGIGQFNAQTLGNLKYYTPTLKPTGLASASANVLWFTQQSDQGALGRMIYSEPVSATFGSYPIPTTGLFPTGIAIAPDGGVWFAAFAPVRTYLPIISRNFAN